MRQIEKRLIVHIATNYRTVLRHRDRFAERYIVGQQFPAIIR